MSDTTLAGRIRTLAESGAKYRLPWEPPDTTNLDKARRAVNALPALADLVEAVSCHGEGPCAGRRGHQCSGTCTVCGLLWPCPTTTALEALAVALGVES